MSRKIGFIGTGKMGGALARAASKNPENIVLLANRHPEKAEKLAESIGGTVTDNCTVAKEADYIFLAVKPQMMEAALDGIKGVLSERKSPFVIVSMLAGVKTDRINGYLEADYPIIRIMPNIPVEVGEGLVLYSATETVGKERVESFLEAMKLAGRFSAIDEKLIDAGSGVSGCGPAYAALFIEALADGGVACGLPRKDAVEYASQMLLGSAKYILEKGVHPGEFKDSVCSPGGTTIQGVRALEESAFRAAVMNAVIKSYERTLEL